MQLTKSPLNMNTTSYTSITIFFSRCAGAADKEADEEEGPAGGAPPGEDREDEQEPTKHILPLTNHQPVV